MMERILLLFAKLNPGIMYVQGMNELLSPIIYVLANDTAADYGFAENVEADTFFCFCNLMSEFKDLFIKANDRSVGGVMSYIDRYSEVLKELDPPVWSLLRSQNVEHTFYAFRWFTTLLTREFLLPDVLRLWDSFFADTDRYDFLVCFCASMVMYKRDAILVQDFPGNLEMLQHYPSTDVNILLQRTMAIRESRVTVSPKSAAGALEENLKKGVDKVMDFFNSL
jgi:hypothetical protein